jgi:uridine kinase
MLPGAPIMPLLLSTTGANRSVPRVTKFEYVLNYVGAPGSELSSLLDCYGGMLAERMASPPYARSMDQTALIRHIGARRLAASRPLVVGVSGYGGSGKSTLARLLAAALPGAVRLRGDDFLDPVRSHKRSVDWDGVQRKRLVSEVLAPLRSGQPGYFRRFDWNKGELGDAESIPSTDLLVVDLVGLFHPDALQQLDIKVWCDVDLGTAAHRGIARDARLGRNHERLWREIWIPNERDFEKRFTPREHADVLYSPPQWPAGG